MRHGWLTHVDGLIQHACMSRGVVWSPASVMPPFCIGPSGPVSACIAELWPSTVSYSGVNTAPALRALQLMSQQRGLAGLQG